MLHHLEQQHLSRPGPHPLLRPLAAATELAFVLRVALAIGEGGRPERRLSAVLSLADGEAPLVRLNLRDAVLHLS